MWFYNIFLIFLLNNLLYSSGSSTAAGAAAAVPAAAPGAPCALQAAPAPAHLRQQHGDRDHVVNSDVLWHITTADDK